MSYKDHLVKSLGLNKAKKLIHEHSISTFRTKDKKTKAALKKIKGSDWN